MVQKQISKKEQAFAAGSERELKYFKEMFLLQSDDRTLPVPKVSQEKLVELFKMVGFEPNETLRKEITNYFSKRKPEDKQISFDDFLKLFSLRENTELPKVRVKNAFRMLSKEYGDKEGMIHRTRIKELFEEIGVDSVEAASLLGQLENEFKDGGYLNFEDYVERQYM